MQKIIYSSRVVKFFELFCEMQIGAVALWPFILVDDRRVTEKEIRHESIHIQQQAELLIIFFFLIYAWDYCVLRIKGVSGKDAYHKIRFEQEAYSKEKDLKYSKERKHFAWWTYKL